MNLRTLLPLTLLSLPLAVVACSDDEDPASTGAIPTSTTSGEGGGPSGQGGAASSTTGVGGGGGTGASGGTGGAGGAEPFACATIREEVLTAQDEVSDGAISVLATVGSASSVYVDGTAGGFMGASTNPWIYIDLAAVARVDMTDLESFESTAWDLAVKRTKWRTNSGDSGAGSAGVIAIAKPFEDVTLADAQAATFEVDAWFDDSCDYPKDQLESLVTALGEGWYDYAGMSLTINDDNVFIIRGANGTSYYKLAIESYYFDHAIFDPGEPTTFNVDDVSGNYGVRIEAL